MIMKILGFMELVFAIIIGLHLLYNMFSMNTVLTAVSLVILRGVIFTISSKDFASIVDLFLMSYVLAALFGIFSNSTITIAVVVWLSQKAFFSLLGH